MKDVMDRLIGIYFRKSYFHVIVSDDGKYEIEKLKTDDECYITENQFIMIVTDKTKNAGWSSDKEKVAELLTVGQEYTLVDMNVGQSSSTLTLKEFPNKTFNTVNFEVKEVRPL